MSQSWRLVVGLFVAIVGGLWTLVATPTICADPGGCGFHFEYWDPTTWLLVLGGLSVTIVGVGIALREVLVKPHRG